MDLRPVFFLLSACLFFGCSRAALVVQKQKVEPSYLASANVGAPDPRIPPSGEMLLAEWWVPEHLLSSGPLLRIQAIFNNYTQTCVEYPITQRIGYQTLAILNERFEETGGFLVYRAEIVTEDGEIYADWTHQLWVKLIDFSDEADKTSASVVEKSRHPSVTETPHL